MAVTIVAAVARNGVIGVDGGLPWRLPGDLTRFKRLTMGHSLVMGRKTFDSIGRALPGRHTIVITRQPDWEVEGVEVVHSVPWALSKAADRDGDVFVVGGAEIYRQTLEVADAMELTEVDQSPEGDTFFPEFSCPPWHEVWRHPEDGFTFVRYEQ